MCKHSPRYGAIPMTSKPCMATEPHTDLQHHTQVHRTTHRSKEPHPDPQNHTHVQRTTYRPTEPHTRTYSAKPRTREPQTDQQNHMVNQTMGKRTEHPSGLLHHIQAKRNRPNKTSSMPKETPVGTVLCPTQTNTTYSSH